MRSGIFDHDVNLPGSLLYDGTMKRAARVMPALTCRDPADPAGNGGRNGVS
jgi:hypothetical protein